MKRIYLVLLIVLFGFGQTFAQNILNAKTPQEITKVNKVQNEDGELVDELPKPMPYPYIDDRDIMWSLVTWEIIDLNEKLNLPLYFPVDTMNISKNRRSLFDIVLRGLKSGEISDVYDDSYFSQKLTKEQILSSLVYTDTLPAGIEQYNAGEPISPGYIRERSLSSMNVTKYKIKGMWFFDKRNGEMKYRLLAICPVAPDLREIDSENPDMVDLFWIWYPGARNLLAQYNVFNEKNTSFSLSFDHILNARRFVGVIYKRDNVYGDRQIADYIKENAMFQLMEADKLKEDIRNFEIDLWNY